jgi:putative nucleotidyltransferase with HDIG domain
MGARSWWLVAAEAIVLLGALVGAGLSSDAEQWQPVELVLILLGLAIVSDLLALQHKIQRITGAFLALVLAMALCGPAPAVLIGFVSVLVDSLRARLEVHKVITNLTVYTLIPLAGGLAIEWLAGRTDLETDNLTFALVVLGAFILAHVLNFAMIAGDISFHTGITFAHQARTIFLPVLPSELVSALLAVSIAILYRETGLAALALLAFVLLVFQYLLRELVRSQRRAEELAALQIGVLASMVETLALRDRMTARHSAAVARYARALAQAHGCRRSDQDLAHTAALLHDIGKFSFPDAILLAPAPLSDEDWRIVRRHPEEGARVVRRMEAYGPVADLILCHHERWDGKGYPRGLAEEQIPLLSRIVAVADAYDVMTARDSYRRPITPTEAIRELRDVAGTQLDPALVEEFVGLLESKGLAFRHADDADFEAELAFERRVREYARPRRVLA